MAKLSRKTLGLAANLLGKKSRTEIENFFYGNDVPTALFVGPNRIALVLNVFKGLEAEHPEKLQVLVHDLGVILDDDARQKLDEALMRDGCPATTAQDADAGLLPDEQVDRVVLWLGARTRSRPMEYEKVQYREFLPVVGAATVVGVCGILDHMNKQALLDIDGFDRHYKLPQNPDGNLDCKLAMAGWSRYKLLRRDKNVSTEEVAKMPKASVRIFVSHCSADVGLVKALVELLRGALCLSAADIRCTSLDGYRLPAGAETDSQLKREVHDCEVLIAVLSTASLDSLYVAFEMGARWGTGRCLIPLLAPGLAPSVLEGPLAGLNALRLDNGSQVFQLVTDVGDYLDVEPEKPAVYESLVNEVLESTASRSSTESIPEPPVPRALPGLDDLSAEGRQLLDTSGEAVAVHKKYSQWAGKVAAWLVSLAPDTGLRAEWDALQGSGLVQNGHYSNHPLVWATFRGMIKKRLRWLSELSAKLAPSSAVNHAVNGGAAESIECQIAAPLRYIRSERMIMGEVEIKNGSSLVDTITKVLLKIDGRLYESTTQTRNIIRVNTDSNERLPWLKTPLALKPYSGGRWALCFLTQTDTEVIPPCDASVTFQAVRSGPISLPVRLQS